MKRIFAWILALMLAVGCLSAMADECNHDWKTGKPATCAEDGNRICTICGKVETVAKTANHSWKTVEATCGKDGMRLCTVCGASEVLKATGAHNMAVTTEPTCKDEGEKTCSVCGHKEKIAKTENHSWKTVEPTCGEDGKKLCTVCGASEVLKATGAHNMAVTTEPTCKDEGEKTCSVCGYKEKIAKTENHSWKTVEATCGKDGKKLCTVCGVSEVLKATGAHDWIIKDAGCETEGKKLCSQCGTTETIEPKGHDWVVGKEPTCTEAGDRVCVACDKSEVLMATGHKAVTIPAVKETCSKTGNTEGSYCEVCGKTLTEPQTIPMKKHSYYSKVVAPTADRSGYTLHTCRYCGKQYSSDRVEALGQGNDRIYGIVTDLDRVVKEYTLNTVDGTAVVKAAAEADGTFAARCLFLSEETVQKLEQTGCDEICFTVGSASVAFPLNALEDMNGTVVITLSVNADATVIGVQATLDDDAATDVTGQLEGMTLTISNAKKNAALATESGSIIDAAFENGVWTIKVAAAETYTIK